mmetsp:Transcript_18711/g.51529  ORF Transcript_18711/g.51529 Transcript_18711/m.51529 type:complete len:200 (-) Transcript_18711:998-1597(-)
MTWGGSRQGVPGAALHLWWAQPASGTMLGAKSSRACACKSSSRVVGRTAHPRRPGRFASDWPRARLLSSCTHVGRTTASILRFRREPCRSMSARANGGSCGSSTLVMSCHQQMILSSATNPRGRALNQRRRRCRGRCSSGRRACEAGLPSTRSSFSTRTRMPRSALISLRRMRRVCAANGLCSIIRTPSLPWFTKSRRL